ncbi:Pyridine nucleotide-disulphide oxidoreductase [Terribacillus aidingensis]|uniref:Pyridine nucleotide-disulphide oxidoreductase n=1 Tax=Terribacillus aidingensis TaxID=586416 RepID=A0A285NXJ6_9BACI|nr:NAD(P)-binding domain-containing protein [Terribacillus aidingensis]SNZ14205.1 Pyridine nucleotide-disulphide oxidoreductase [Terribacillus aidingensis]
MSNQLPVVIIGAGPVGLAAAAHLVEYDLPFVILEKGESVGSNILEWGHVQLFSPWEYNTNQAATKLLAETEWQHPDKNKLPTGQELVNEYLKPLSQLQVVQENTRYNSQVVAVTKDGADKLKSDNRGERAFVVHYKIKSKLEKVSASAIIDASGTWQNPNPPYADGVWLDASISDSVHTNIPAVQQQQEVFKDKHTVVIGSGHSAMNTLLNLAELKKDYPLTKISWVLRRESPVSAFGGEEQDQLAARGALGSSVHKLVDQGVVDVFALFNVEAIDYDGSNYTLSSKAGRIISSVDEIVVNTGARPDFSFLREVRYVIDPIVESTPALAPLIDPNLHSCGTVRPHGEGELRHPEKNFYVAGVKSYGRAPTFLLSTGYEQVRSIVASIAGDAESAKQVKLKLPETGVCKTDIVTAKQRSCCGC